jgi:alginate O-acetyltransferase complex protein AlgI
MVFSSISFLFYFLPLMLIAYYIVPDWLKNGVLLAFSLVFYAWGEPVYIILMLYSIFMNYIFGRLMDDHRTCAKEILIFTVVLNIGILAFFKYSGFLVRNINAIFGLHIPIRTLALPIGISFYTFQALSYIIDLYREKYPAQRKFVTFAAYITMFPQLIAGPIVRYEDVRGELEHKELSLERFGKGAVRFLFGLAKKVLLANLVGSLFDTIHALGTDISTATAWIAAISYTFQIYFDFSGYSDMAIGLGEMLGISFQENFNYPYAAGSVTEFWRRWHISLGTWFREYVYIPLGGNRVPMWKHIRNILIVWLLTGLWHGASWNFVLWGLYYGVLLLWEKYVWCHVKSPKVINRLFTLLAVVFGWVIFTADSVPQIASSAMRLLGIGGNGLVDAAARYYFSTNWRLLLIEGVCCMPIVRMIYQKLCKTLPGRIVLGVILAALFAACIAYLVTQNYNPFLYFQF